MSDLKNDFYKVQTKTIVSEKQLAIVIELNASHPIYNGHFPEMPVVPGVCQVQIIKELLEENLNQKLIMVSGDNIKFTGLIVPTKNAIINIELSHALKDNGLISADVKFFFENIIFTKFKGTFKAGE